MQAVQDWRALCRGRKETRTCNFKELERFFERECEVYIDRDVAKKIYNKLKLERKAKNEQV